MALVTRGGLKGKTVTLLQFANDWMLIRTSTGMDKVLSPTSLLYTPAERKRIDTDGGKGFWPYAWQPFVDDEYYALVKPRQNLTRR